ncbi:hypothetical protein [Lactococcus petauri]|uniref:hypothetical protein n=1 Tax=Lactococcus petauri TaxID=1940789 RepID=UPI003852ADA0
MSPVCKPTLGWTISSIRFPTVFEIIIDFDEKTVANIFDKCAKQSLHSNLDVKELSKQNPLVLRIYFTLGEVLTITEEASNTGESYQTYRKILQCAFDKTGLEVDEYNRLTDDIGTHIEKMERFWRNSVEHWQNQGILDKAPFEIFPRKDW